MKVEGVWTDVNTEQPLSRPDPPWYKKPNGAHLENCLQARVSLSASELNFTASWNDSPCDYSYCYFCRFHSAPTLKLRGLSPCQLEIFDEKYKWKNSLQDEKYVLQGRQGSQISWTASNRSWTVSSKFGARQSGTIRLTGSKTEYPAGRLAWLVEASEDCQASPGLTRLLHLTSCGEEEFNCADGTCIDIRARCDLNNDCQANRLLYSDIL